MLDDVLRSQLAAVVPAARADLEALARIPSISSMPEHAADVRQVVEAVAGLAREAGAEQVEVVAAGGHPALIAHWPAPAGKPTVLLYAHADVQPTGPDEEWTSPPFEPTERDGRLYGRGAADDKAGVAMHLAVIRAFGGKPPVGVVLFVEGEEEIGSPTLQPLLADHREKLAADVIVIADAGNASVEIPAFTTSLRGLVETFVEVKVLERSAHSGVFGGPIVDALTALCRLLATLHDETGAVAVEGLYAEDSSAPDLPEAVFRGDSALVPSAELVGCGSLPTRLWSSPAIAVLGIDAPSVADASNILIPKARAKVSVRIAPGDESSNALKALHRHLESRIEWGAELTLTAGAAADPFAIEADGSVYRIAHEVFTAAYGNEAVETGIGGSIPFISLFARTYPGSTVLVTGVGDPASRWHGIDESLHLGMWENACFAELLLLHRLADQAG